jgi:hypothetical protein
LVNSPHDHWKKCEEVSHAHAYLTQFCHLTGGTIRLKQFHDVHNILVIFPNEAAEISTVVLVYDPLSAYASPLPDEKRKHLDDVEKEVLKMVKDAADVKSQSVPVEKRWHDAIVGHGGTTLNAYAVLFDGPVVKHLYNISGLSAKTRHFPSRLAQKLAMPLPKISFSSVGRAQM